MKYICCTLEEFDYTQKLFIVDEEEKEVVFYKSTSYDKIPSAVNKARIEKKLNKMVIYSKQSDAGKILASNIKEKIADSNFIIEIKSI